MTKLRYTPPPTTKVPTQRRVYHLPDDLVRRIHAYGQTNQFRTEVDIVRHLLESALNHLVVDPEKEKFAQGILERAGLAERPTIRTELEKKP